VLRFGRSEIQTRKIAVKLCRRFIIGQCGSDFTFKQTKMNGFVFNRNGRLPFASSLVPANAKIRRATLRASIAAILTLCCQSQIFQPIVSRVQVTMIHKPCWPFAIPDRPYGAMRKQANAIYATTLVAALGCSRKGFLACIFGIPNPTFVFGASCARLETTRQPFAPIERAAFWVVSQPLAQNFGGNHDHNLQAPHRQRKGEISRVKVAA